MLTLLRIPCLATAPTPRDSLTPLHHATYSYERTEGESTNAQNLQLIEFTPTKAETDSGPDPNGEILFTIQSR